jgi:hypothetical protein
MRSLRLWGIASGAAAGVLVAVFAWPVRARGPSVVAGRSRPPADGLQKSLTSPERRAAWEYVRANHPHASLGGWTLQPGFSAGPMTCVPDGARHFFFIRVLPENGALGLDWADVRWERGTVVSMESKQGPDVTPASVQRKPALTAAQAWQRAAAELRACGCVLSSRYRHSPPTRLRLLQEGPDIRLVYRFLPPESAYSICVDALTGEVGQRAPVSIAAMLNDPLQPANSPRRGHRIDRLGAWVPTRPAVTVSR